MTPLQFVALVACMDTETEMDEAGSVMEADDAIDTINDLIYEARAIQDRLAERNN